MGLHLPKLRPRPVAAMALSAAAVLLSGCSAEDKTSLKRLAQPETITKQGESLHNIWIWAWVAALIVGALTWGLMAFVSIRYRRRSEDQIPVQTRYNLPIEVFYTIAPIMMVIVFFYFTVQVQDEVNAKVDSPDHVVTVVGQKWSWTFNYNTTYDTENREYIEADTPDKRVYEVGTTARKPTLWLVKDQTVEIHLASPDVIHSFWVPAFLYKMDVVPGRDNHFQVTPTRTGTFVGRCSELCGLYHSRMLFDVKIVTQDEYDAHLAELEEQGNTGGFAGGGTASEIAGLNEGESQ